MIAKINGSSYSFFCPGCNKRHLINDTWAFNGDPDKPTFTPSILVSYRHPTGFTNSHPAPLGYSGFYTTDVCHSFVTDGMIEFLGDSTHALAGQTVPLPEFPVS